MVSAVNTPATLRPLYEALFELREAVTAASPNVARTILLERWNFDNGKKPPEELVSAGFLAVL